MVQGQEGDCRLWRQRLWGRGFSGRVFFAASCCAKFVPIEAVVEDKGGDVLESLKCDGMCDGGLWGVGMEAFPVGAIVADEVGDRAEDLVWYDGGHGVVRRRRGD